VTGIYYHYKDFLDKYNLTFGNLIKNNITYTCNYWDADPRDIKCMSCITKKRSYSQRYTI